MDLLNSHILSLMTFLPLVTCVLVLASPTLASARWVSMGGSLVTFLLSLHVWYYFDAQTPGLQFTEAHSWIPAFGMKFLIGGRWAEPFPSC